MTMTNTDPHANGGGAAAVEALKASGGLDEVFKQIDAGSLTADSDGFIQALIKAAMERGLQAELTGHLGYEKGSKDASSVSNSRNGSTPKTVESIAGPVQVDVPRDREGSFEPVLLPKGQRRIGGLDSMIISLYAGGMTIRDIQHHLATTMGTELSHETISKITDAVLEEVTAWQERPLEEFYPVMFMDAIRVRVRTDGRVMTRSAYIAVGVDMDGIKHVLGIWVQDNEGASFWAGVCAELANRGVADVLIVCCDGLKGFPEAIEATWPNSVVQTCVVHLIRAANRFVAYQDRKAVSKALKAVYTAINADAAAKALDEFEASEWGTKYPQAVAVFRNAWEQFTPFLAFPPMLRKVIYTTNSIESLIYQLRKVTKARGHFPNTEAVVKLLWLAIRNIEDKRARQRAKDAGKPAGKRTAPGRLVEGAVTTNWKQALAQLAVAYPERINPYL